MTVHVTHGVRHARHARGQVYSRSIVPGGLNFQLHQLNGAALMLETFLVGLFGFFTDVFAWWLFFDVPGLSTAFFFWLSLALGASGFLFGLWRPEGTHNKRVIFPCKTADTFSMTVIAYPSY